jgi:putative FmdB family regulatory protein
MPIYEYRCSECGHQEEHLQKVSEVPLAQCPACGRGTYKKLLSAAGFQLKGSGWYATDFKGGGAAKKDKADDGKAGAKSESKSDSKPDPKPDSKPKSETPA